MKTLLSLLGFLYLLVPDSRAWAEEVIILEDWSGCEVGAKGIPPGWTGQSWGSPRYDLTIVEDDGRRALHLKSKNESSTINKKIARHINLRDTSILQWQWKVLALPTGGDSRQEDALDQAVQLYVSWPRFPRAIRSRIIGYVWDSSAPVGTVVRSSKTRMVTYIVIRSGNTELGHWMTERRNVWEDYRMVFGEDPKELGYISLSIDTNDTQSYAESLIGAIVFARP